MIIVNVLLYGYNYEFRPLVALVPLSYEYRNNWETEEGGIRGEKYKILKEEVEKILLGRIEKHMGSDFIAAVSYKEFSTPMTFERYTYSKKGSFIGWSIEKSQYGKFLKQRTAIKDLYLVGV